MKKDAAKRKKLSKAEKRENFSKTIVNHFNALEKASKGKKAFLTFVPLAFPCILLTILYCIFRVSELKRIELLFMVVVGIASAWFILAPILLYKHIKVLKDFCNNPKYPDCVNIYFRNNKRSLYGAFIHYMLVYELVGIPVGIGPILIFPEILTKNLTHGHGDVFFYMDIVFIWWMCTITICAPAFLSLFSFHVLKDLKEGKVLCYNPLDEKHRDTVNSFLSFSNQSIAFASSGSVFLPLAIYYIFQQPTMSLTLNGKFSLSFYASSAPNSIYILWVLACLAMYIFIAVFFSLYPNIVVSKYIAESNRKIIVREQLRLICKNDTQNLKENREKQDLATAIMYYNDYNRLQELKQLCKKPVVFDANLMLTCVSIISTSFSILVCILQLL